MNIPRAVDICQCSKFQHDHVTWVWGRDILRRDVRTSAEFPQLLLLSRCQ